MIPVPVLTGIATRAGTILGQVLGEEINKRLFVRTEVKRLKVNYGQIIAMINKAEQTAAVFDDETNNLVMRIKDHMYDVEDIVDIWLVKDEKRRSVKGSLKCSFGSCKNVILSSQIYSAIKVLNEDFDKILKLSLEKLPNDRTIRSYGKTAPDRNADVMGDYVQKDSHALIDLLKDESTCRLIAIVGTVGIGKTTLARQIYHNASCFDIKVWIRFSKDLRSLMMWSESDSRKEDATKAQLQELGLQIAGKRFLLVIDDVWTENVWETLLEGNMQHGEYGSKVILTTRHKHVAKRIGAGHIHYVKRMNDVDAWRLLCQRALVNKSDEAELKDIGRRIVQKCDGLPIAIRSIGRTLRGRELTRHDWEIACRTAFHDLSPEEQYTINLSFQDLPSFMKQCFLYCSIFPEGYLIEKPYITQHWISEGFIEKKGKYTLEEIAEDYFDEFIGRGLLQLEFGPDGMARARMPNIIRSFAKYLSDHENFCNDSIITSHKFYEVRRLCIVGNTEANMWDINNVRSDKNFSISAVRCGIVGGNKANHNNEEVTSSTYNGSSARIDEIVENNEPNDDTKAVESDVDGTVGNNESNNSNTASVINGANSSKRLQSMKSLRTIILCSSDLPKGILGYISKLTLLRVLDLHRTDIEALPGSIGRLEHLRYLNISYTYIRMVPEAIGSLRMLQYLLLKNCKLSNFPKVIEKLRNLRSIDISGTGLDGSRWKFDHVEELSSIRGFYLKNDSIKKLLSVSFPKKLTSLQIVNLEKTVELPAGNELPLKKLHLKDLELCYAKNNEPMVTEGELDNTEKMLDRLRPHNGLVSLKITNYCGIRYPSWISRTALRNLQQLHLETWLMCDNLPTLSDLPQLKVLAIAGFHRLGNLSVEPRNEQMVAFPKLEQLQLYNMKVLHSFLDIKGQHLPCIRRISVLNCPQLTTIPRYLKKSETLARFEIDEESRVGVKKMIGDLRVGIVLIVGNHRQEMNEADADNIAEAGNNEPVVAAEVGDQNFDDVGDNYAAPTVQPNGHARWNVTGKILSPFKNPRMSTELYLLAAFAISFLALSCVLIAYLGSFGDLCIKRSP